MANNNRQDHYVMNADEIIILLKPLLENAQANQTDVISALLSAHEKGPHHAFVASEIQREKRRQERWEILKGNFVFWFATGITGMIGLALWNHFIDKQ